MNETFTLYAKTLMCAYISAKVNAQLSKTLYVISNYYIRWCPVFLVSHKYLKLAYVKYFLRLQLWHHVDTFCKTELRFFISMRQIIPCIVNSIFTAIYCFYLSALGLTALQENKCQSNWRFLPLTSRNSLFKLELEGMGERGKREVSAWMHNIYL